MVARRAVAVLAVVALGLAVPCPAAACEGAVNEDLLDLAHMQEADGSWRGPGPLGPVGTTSLGVLAFAVNGYGPRHKNPPELGRAVKNASAWLLARQAEDGRFEGADGRDQTIAALAVLEMFAVTRAHALRGPAERALAAALAGRRRDGSFDDPVTMAFAVLALESARASELPVALEGPGAEAIAAAYERLPRGEGLAPLERAARALAGVLARPRDDPAVAADVAAVAALLPAERDPTFLFLASFTLSRAPPADPLLRERWFAAISDAQRDPPPEEPAGRALHQVAFALYYLYRRRSG